MTEREKYILIVKWLQTKPRYPNPKTENDYAEIVTKIDQWMDAFPLKEVKT